jgi:Phosphoribosyl transferase (PRTase)/PELOTA RNA binding domain
VSGSSAQRPLVRSSYDSREVTFLLTDLSGADLELETSVRERAIQSGRNYAEMLPIEYAPPAEYLALFDALVAATARRTAELVGIVCEQLLDAHGTGLTLVSLARSGTPVGILMRRYLALRHGLDVPHYSVSIVRGVGIDTVALGHICTLHDPMGIVFVDGWTGKGAIVTELRNALADYEATDGIRVSSRLAVLVDPGRCAETFGSRTDELIASACLNSTVCGLVSRTVFNRDLLSPGEFHGAKVYGELADHDRSGIFLDAVTAHFDEVATDVEAAWRAIGGGDRTTDFAGADEVRRIQDLYALPNWHLVKPGVGETTRVLLRRMPSKILVHPDARERLQHVLLLAHDRGVEVVDYASPTYACVGLIAPVLGEVT